MQEKSAGQLGYRPEFDGLRAFAVFLVLADHYNMGILESLIGPLPIGLFGVRLFFVLSGFLITSILLDFRATTETKGQKFTTKNALQVFYQHRFLRVVPAYYLLLSLEFIWGDPAFRQVMWWHVAYLSNTVSAVFSEPKAYGDLIHPQTAHLWTLSVEAQFYLVWPFLVLLARSRRLIVTFAMALVLIAPISRAFFFLLGYQFDVGYLISSTDTLGAGALLAMWRQGWLPWLTQRIFHTLVLAAFGLFTLCVSFNLIGKLYRPQVILFPIAEAILYCWLLSGLLDGKLAMLGRALRTQAVVYIGKISYGIYLYHAFVWDRILRYVFDITDSYPLTQSAISMAATIAFASLSWHLFERPLMRWKT